MSVFADLVSSTEPNPIIVRPSPLCHVTRNYRSDKRLFRVGNGNGANFILRPRNTIGRHMDTYVYMQW